MAPFKRIARRPVPQASSPRNDFALKLITWYATHIGQGWRLADLGPISNFERQHIDGAHAVVQQLAEQLGIYTIKPQPADEPPPAA
jgi:hypothetical protein